MTPYAQSLVDYVCRHNGMGPLEAFIFCDEHFAKDWDYKEKESGIGNTVIAEVADPDELEEVADE